MSNFDNMGKEELRAACKAAQVKGWGKMNNTQMRVALNDVALRALDNTAEDVAKANAALPVIDDAQLNTPEVKALSELSKPESEQLPKTDSRVAPTPEFLDTLGIDGVKGHCPHCDVHLDNGYQTVEGIREVSPAQANKMQREYVCLGCNGEYGPKIVRTPAKPVVNPTGVKIQKDREERNGVKRPSVGTICNAIWTELDKLYAANKATPSFKDLKALQDKHNWQRNTAVTQYQRWKEFNDLMVR
jgi:hypothetical protein